MGALLFFVPPGLFICALVARCFRYARGNLEPSGNLVIDFSNERALLCGGPPPQYTGVTRTLCEGEEAAVLGRHYFSHVTVAFCEAALTTADGNRDHGKGE